MKFLLVGKHRSGTLEGYTYSALTDLGHKVRLFDPQGPLYGLKRLFCADDRKRYNRELLKEVTRKKFDCVLFFKGRMVDSETLRELKKRSGVVLANWFSDNPFHAQYCGPAVRECIPEYHIIFIHDTFFIPQLRLEGVETVEFLPFACLPALHHRKDDKSPLQTNGKRFKVVFMGTHYPEREELLAGLSDLPLSIWGNLWGDNVKDKRLIPLIQGPALYDEKQVEIYCRSDIVLNIHQMQNVNAANMRSFEATGCGTFLLSDYRKDLSDLFEIGKEVSTYSGPEDLRNNIEHFLKMKDERNRIADAGYRHAHQNHTYQKRAMQIISSVEKISHHQDN